VHGGDFLVFRPLVQELLNIDQFCQKSLMKLKFNINFSFEASSLFSLKAFGDCDFLEAIL
jgi:hypothetical protein